MVVQPVLASQPSAPVAATRTISASIAAHTGYSAVSHSNKVASAAIPLVAH